MSNKTKSDQEYEAQTEVIKGQLETMSHEDGSKTLIFLTGNAPKEILPEKISLSGDIKTVGNFLRVRQIAAFGNQIVDKAKAVVLVDKEKLSIDLHLDPESVYNTTVKGMLEVSTELQQFHINGGKMFNKEQFLQLIKFNKLLFPHAVEHDKLVKEVMKAASTVNIRSADSADERGNKTKEFVKEVQTNVPSSFVLECPIYKGFPKETFPVNICLDAIEGSLRFWLESIELHELLQIRRDQILDDELKAAEGFVIVNK